MMANDSSEEIRERVNIPIEPGEIEKRDMPVNQPVTLPSAEVPAEPPSGGGGSQGGSSDSQGGSSDSDAGSSDSDAGSG